MNAERAAEQLRALASRVRRNHPMRNDPERFHIEVSEIAHELADIAEWLVPCRSGRVERANGGQAKVTPIRGKSRVIVTTEVIAGRRVTVQHRRLPFAIHVGD